jgi:hypothetical protein
MDMLTYLYKNRLIIPTPKTELSFTPASSITTKIEVPQQAIVLFNSVITPQTPESHRCLEPRPKHCPNAQLMPPSKIQSESFCGL